MDNKLDLYFKNEFEANPPHISEYKIRLNLAKRRQRWLLISVSVAALLWSMAFAFMVACVSQQNEVAAFAMTIAISVGLICAGIFSGLVLKFRKVGI